MTVLRDGIVAGYDGSTGSDQALRWAVREARARGCPLTVCLAWSPPDPAMPGEAAVVELARNRGAQTLARGLRYAESVLGPGRAAPLLVRGPATYALCKRSTAGELVVLGSRGSGGITGLALGSVAWQVSGHAKGPVVVVRGHPRSHNQHPGPVVAGVDGSAVSAEALGFAFREAELQRVPLLVVCALADAPAMLGGAHRVEAEFAHLTEVQEKEHPDVAVSRLVSAGSPRTALLDAAAGARLLVVGSRGRGGLRGMRLGSAAQAMLHHAPCPVAVLHP